uniref:Putative ovule protein n=1 Tax=Solanum chacoense TaxID=4108 RepID=A0A0V0HIA0_SOLCH
MTTNIVSFFHFYRGLLVWLKDKSQANQRGHHPPKNFPFSPCLPHSSYWAELPLLDHSHICPYFVLVFSLCIHNKQLYRETEVNIFI